MKMTRGKLLEIKESVDSLFSMKFDPSLYPDASNAYARWQRFAYAVSRTKDSIVSEVKATLISIEPPAEYMEYENKLQELKVMYADKDKDGKPIMQGNRYVITADMAKYYSEAENLTHNYRDVVSEMKVRSKTVSSFLLEEVEVNIYKTSFSNCPGGLTLAQLSTVMAMSIESEKEIEDLLSKG